MRFDQRHLLGIEPLRPDEITTLLDLAERYVTLSRARDKHANALAELKLGLSIPNQLRINCATDSCTRAVSSASSSPQILPLSTAGRP